ncbi:Cyclin-dependent kinase inhibitor 3 [Morus notabilis]|uniref:Cyclin-dependent kinase inhibitor 3 n=1 Tax=Morus notabilis TaxID=981085 RepID=W9SB81_9ROSA|nr:cyclin-dependent kinase inhibitor 3 [Morus notabilis]EXC24197.1 Cyclin-dependent kinase inhibitor 3 [Morus notabilis]
MGKYMKKSKITGDVAVMEVSLSPQCSLGVRTRAKTLALQRQQQEKQHQKSISSPDFVDTSSDSSSFSYLELRSRRLEKPPRLGDAKRRNHQNQKSAMAERCCGGNPSPQIPRPNSRLRVESEDKEAVALEGDEAEDFNEVILEASFGENNLDIEGRDRSTRESTPCSLIRGSDTVGTPGSTTRQKSYTATSQRVRNDMQRSIPTAHEMDEFFAFAEQQQQRIFIEKYNFDIVKDSPLPGRYEWVQVIP